MGPHFLAALEMAEMEFLLWITAALRRREMLAMTILFYAKFSSP
jgi:hypothetical protein